MIVRKADERPLEGKTGEAVGNESLIGDDGFKMMDSLSEITSCEIPAPLAAIKSKPVRFNQVVDREEMSRVVLDMLGIE